MSPRNLVRQSARQSGSGIETIGPRQSEAISSDSRPLYSIIIGQWDAGLKPIHHSINQIEQLHTLRHVIKRQWHLVSCHNLCFHNQINHLILCIYKKFSIIGSQIKGHHNTVHLRLPNRCVKKTMLSTPKLSIRRFQHNIYYQD